jgi:hypothetical protein
MLLREAYYVQLLKPRHKIIFKIAGHEIVLGESCRNRASF